MTIGSPGPIMRLVVLVSLFLVGYATTGVPIEDPCIQHRLFPRLNIGSRNERCQPPPSTVCDYYLPEDWYAMKEESILTHCPTTGNCGVGYPGWLNGTLPSKDDGIVNRTVCIKWYVHCCKETIDILVKQCVDFYVFYLKPFDYCPAAYCVESNQSCVRQTPPPTSIPAPIDPCKSHQKFPQRLFGSRNERCMPPVVPVCDYYLEEDWYTVDEGKLLSHCPQSGYCGVGYPVWLNGSLPRVSDGVVERPACVKDNSDCCSKKIEVKIKNCRHFYVYYLKPLDACPSGYCFESKQPCEGSTKPSTPHTMTAIVDGEEAKSIVGSKGEEGTIVGYKEQKPKAPIDPCKSHNKFPQRLFGSRNERCTPPVAPVCDYYLEEDWYTVDEGTLLSHCPQSGYCGVGYPVWLNGSLPRVSDGVVERSACVKHNSDCCRRKIEVKIKNCRHFFVYYLKPLNACPSGYCFESNQPCGVSTQTSTPHTMTAIVDSEEAKSIVGSQGEEESIVGVNERQSKVGHNEQRPKGSFDPCKRHLEFPKRHFGSRNERCMPPTVPMCDYYLKKGWYSVDYGTLLSHCPETGYCGVGYPAWLNGSLPDVSDGVVERTACIKHNSNCCRNKFTIKIKRCNQFYVYYLKPLKICPSGYCFESSQPCEESTTTSTTHQVTVMEPSQQSEESTTISTTRHVTAIVNGKRKTSIVRDDVSVGGKKRKPKDAKKKKMKANGKKRKMRLKRLRKKMEKLRMKKKMKMEKKAAKMKRRKMRQMNNKHHDRRKRRTRIRHRERRLR